MAEYIAFDERVEVNGQTVQAVIDGMGAFESKARQILADVGIPDPQPDHWYHQQDWLDAFKAIGNQVGPNTLYAIGKKIPENAAFPPEIADLRGALSAIDIAYHMNHRIGDRILFDPDTGEMLDGIGHYYVQHGSNRHAEVICDNPYPCDFDRGIITTMATRFKPDSSLVVRVEHDNHAPCRKKGADACRYVVSW